MAENEITYIPYGQDEISQQDLMTSLANGVESYLGSKRWARKDKYRQAWLNAYQDIINNGLTGASNESGIWTVNQKNPIDLNSKSNAEREMYQDAAYYIQQKMAQMTPRKKEEEKKKEDLEKYGNFGTNLMNRILKRYGNNSELFKDSEQGWDAQDVRGANGLRGTEKRRAAMIAELEAYKKDLDNQDLNYNFEGTAFKDKADLQTKIQTAIDALKNTPNDESDDLPAFSALGLPYRAFFNNGGNDIYTTEDGKQVTYKQYYENQQKVAQDEAKAKKQAAYNNTLFINRVTSSKMLGQNAQALKTKYGDHNSLFTALQGYSQKDIRTLSPEEQSEVQGIYRYLAKDPIDNNLLKQLQGSSSGLYKNSAPNRFRKIKGIDNLIWDSVAGQVIQINNRQQQQALQNQPTDLFEGVQTSEEKQNTPISKEGWTSADSADVVSMIGDLVSLGGLWANIGGTATSLTADIYSDYTRGKSTWDILKGVGANLGWGLAGMLPGAKSTKLIARAGRLVPKAIMLYQSYNTATDPEVIKSAMKFTSVEGLKTVSSKDLENLKYLFHAVTGGANIAKSHYRAKNYRETLNKQEVNTKNGKASLSNEQVKEINKVGRKSGQKAAEDKFKEYTKGQEAAEGQFKFSEKGLSRFNPARYNSLFSKVTSNDKTLKGKQVTDNEALAKILQEDAERPWYHWNKGYTKSDLAFTDKTNIKTQNQKNSNKQELPKQNTEQPKALESKPTKREQQFDKAAINRYKEHLKGSFSNKKIQEGSLKVGDSDMNVKSTTNKKNGKITYDIHFGNKHFYNLTQDKAKKRIFDLVKQNRKQVDESGKVSKKSTKEIGKILQDLKRKGWLKQGGTLNPYVDNVIEDFLKNNNI